MCSHTQSREEGGCEEGVSDSFSFLSETAAGNANKQTPQHKSHLLPLPPHTGWGDSWVTAACPSPQGGSDAVNPGPHVKEPGAGCTRVSRAPTSTSSSEWKNISCAGTAAPKEERGAYFSLLPALAESCWSQQLFARIGKRGMRESISKPELHKSWSCGKRERKGLKLQLLTSL